jgi:hypothetical protein
MWPTAGVAEAHWRICVADIPEWSEEAVLTDELSARGLIGDGVALYRGVARRLASGRLRPTRRRVGEIMAQPSMARHIKNEHLAG